MQGVAGSNPAVPIKNLNGDAVNKKLLEILACPACKGKLIYKNNEQELICQLDKLAYPIRDGIPVMLIEEARSLGAQEE